ncbi:MAG: proton-conducting transporter transmembrane domain-containing protein [Candidatus Nitrosocosmicus sp.]
MHFWLPKMHVEASTSARIILASLLLKFGVRGFGRFAGPLIF